MASPPRRHASRTLAVTISLAAATSGCLPPSLAATIILEPYRRTVGIGPTLPYREVAFPGEGVELRGWLFPAEGRRQGTAIFLHGRNQNRRAGLIAARQLVPLGWDVLVYDSRGHGASGGKYATFGYWEKRDVSHAIDFLGVAHVVLIGHSLGGAVAIQAAAMDPRVTSVVAFSAFASLDSVVRDRLPWFVPESHIRRALCAVERRGQLRVSEVDVVAAARRVTVPVLLVHGALDGFTPLTHSMQIYRALRAERKLVEIAGANHGDVLRREASWRAIRGWLAAEEPRQREAPGSAEQLTSSVTTSTETAGPNRGATSMRSGNAHPARERIAASR
jgi:uncharacterized protein